MITKLFATTLAVFWAAAVASADESGKRESVPKKDTELVELHVSGMSCHNCSDAVEDLLAAVDGVEVESVDAKRNLAVLRIAKGTLKREQLVAALEDEKKYAVEKTEKYRKLEYENDGSFSLDGKPFTGTATDTHKKSGNKSKNYQFKDGKLHGLVREWYDNGKLSGRKFYKEGKRHGKTEYWDEEGNLTDTKIYRDDVHVDEDGKPVEHE